MQIDSVDVQKTVEVLKSGGLILYPTDTIWGIGCDATNTDAVNKIFKLKNCDLSQSMIVLVDVPGRIPSYTNDVPDIAWDLIELADKPLTVIFPKAKNLAPNLISNNGCIGIRVVNHAFCQRIIQRLGKPIVSTSANLSGQPFPTNYKDICQEIKNNVDHIVPEIYDNPIINKPSSIISLSEGGLIKVIRE